MDYKTFNKGCFEKAKRLYKTANADQRYVLEKLFPELRETEDEKMRKWIIDDIRFNMNNEPLNNSEYRKNAEKAIAWLEKQGEQKPILDFKAADWYVSEVDGKIHNIYHSVDKVEPIFNVGDKIQYSKGCGTIMTIEKIENGEYIFANNMGHTTIENGNKCYLVENKDTWTEKDEKIWKELIEEVKDQLDSVPAPDCRDKEDEKVLKQLTRWLDWLKSFKGRVQPQAKEWSKDDKNHMANILNILLIESKNAKVEQYRSSVESDIDWIYSLKNKDRVQPKQEWSEEDNKWIESLIQTFEDGYFEGFNQLESYGVIDWLKSLKNKYKNKSNI